MSKTISSIVTISDLLKDAGYETYSNVLKSYIKKSDHRGNYVVGFAGDDLVGKSTIINLVLGNNVLPANVIPENVKYSIRYGEDDKIVKDSGEKVPLSELENMSGEEACIQLEINSPYLRDGNIELVEFSNLLSFKKINNISLMTSLYHCDAAVLVMSAEHLFSETECGFIENYIKYVGADHLLLIVNKLSMVNKIEVGNVIE